MKYRIISLFLCMLMIDTVVPIGGTLKDSPINPMVSSNPTSSMKTNRNEIPFNVAGTLYYETPASTDGNTAMVGVFRGYGSVYVFTERFHIWRKQQQIYSPETGGAYSFGWSVSVSGDTAVFGAPVRNWNASPGCAYVYSRMGISWIYQAKLLPPDGRDYEFFGTSVSLDGDTVVIGAPNDDDNGNSSGSAYVFTRNGTTWALQAKLLASGGGIGDNFGYFVSLDGDTVLIGAPWDSDKGADSGSTYVFTRSGTNWTQQAKLLASDGVKYDQFGISVSLDRDTALIGASDFNEYSYIATGPGSAYVFTRTDTTWTQQAKILASDGANGDRFGYSVSLSGDSAFIGAFWDCNVRNGRYFFGSAYVFTRTGTIWAQQQKLQVYNGVSRNFGISVALEDNTAIISSYYEGDVYIHSSAYAFGRIGNIWIKQIQLFRYW
jgi:hypothetical protein